MRTVMTISFVLALIASGASAQTAASPPAKKSGMMSLFKPKPKPPGTMSTTHTAMTSSAMSTSGPVKTAAGRKPRTPESIACSQQADSKGLHGADRKKFRSGCMRAAK